MMDNRPWINRYDPGVPGHLEYPQITAFEMLEQAARRYPEQDCLVTKHSTLTYAAVNGLSDRLAAGLVGFGVKKGDRVGLVLPNMPQFVISYFGILKAGAVVVAVNPMYKPHEMRVQFLDAGVEVLLALDSLLPTIQQASAGTKIREVIVVNPDEGRHLQPLSQVESEKVSTSFVRLEDLLAAYLPEQRPQITVTPEDEALFQYSGGTTGTSKAAVAIHRNLVANAVQFRHWLVGTQDGQETMLLAIPLYHVYGMVVGMLVAVRLGARMALVPNPRDLDDLLSTIQEQRASIFPGVPNLYNAIINHAGVQAGKYDLRTVKACISGSAPLMRDTKDRFEALTGGKLLEGYGLSEAPTATHCNPMLGENRTGSIGLPLPDVDCRIVSLEDGSTPLEVGQVGELILRGPQVMKGYHSMPEETSLAIRYGWLYTGDIARMDVDGYFYLVDRKKDVIKPGGFQVWPREVEEVLAQHPKVLEAGVAGVLEGGRGEVVKAWVVLREQFRPGADAEAAEITEYTQSVEQELRDFCRDKLASFKVPSLFEFRTELPKTNVGKLLRRELVRQHYDGNPASMHSRI